MHKGVNGLDNRASDRLIYERNNNNSTQKLVGSYPDISVTIKSIFLLCIS
jgi:hypothetical protein